MRLHRLGADHKALLHFPVGVAQVKARRLHREGKALKPEGTPLAPGLQVLKLPPGKPSPVLPHAHDRIKPHGLDPLEERHRDEGGIGQHRRKSG